MDQLIVMMKVHAFEDRRLKGQRDKERQHALDLYAIVGMMAEAEYELVDIIGQIGQTSTSFRQAGQETNKIESVPDSG